MDGSTSSLKRKERPGPDETYAPEYCRCLQMRVPSPGEKDGPSARVFHKLIAEKWSQRSAMEASLLLRQVALQIDGISNFVFKDMVPELDGVVDEINLIIEKGVNAFYDKFDAAVKRKLADTVGLLQPEVYRSILDVDLCAYVFRQPSSVTAMNIVGKLRSGYARYIFNPLLVGRRTLFTSDPAEIANLICELPYFGVDKPSRCGESGSPIFTASLTNCRFCDEVFLGAGITQDTFRNVGYSRNGLMAVYSDPHTMALQSITHEDSGDYQNLWQWICGDVVCVGTGVDVLRLPEIPKLAAVARVYHNLPHGKCGIGASDVVQLMADAGGETDVCALGEFYAGKAYAGTSLFDWFPDDMRMLNARLTHAIGSAINVKRAVKRRKLTEKLESSKMFLQTLEETLADRRRKNLPVQAAEKRIQKAKRNIKKLQDRTY